MNSKANKKHHFVPECYLKNFIIKKDLYVVNVPKVKIGHQKKLHVTQPASVCYFENYYQIDQYSDYDQFLLNTYEDLHVEREVLRKLEGKYPSLYKKL